MADVNHVANGTSHEGLTKPVTYGDVFGASGKIGEEAVTNEDAALMQSAETVTLGKTQKGGAAATMQAAAQLNVSEGLVDRDAHSSVAEEGVSVMEILVPGTRVMKIVWQRESDPSRSVAHGCAEKFCGSMALCGLEPRCSSNSFGVAKRYQENCSCTQCHRSNTTDVKSLSVFLQVHK
jgi:hypothetical protein